MAWYSYLNPLRVTNYIGEKIGDGVYHTMKAVGISDDQIIDTYDSSPILTKVADTGDFMMKDPDRAAVVAGRSLVEKGPGSIMAIPGDIADAVDTYVFDFKDDESSWGDGTRGWWNSNVKSVQEAVGIKPLEIRSEEEAFLSGLYGEIPAVATIFVGNGAGVTRLATKYPKVANAMRVVAPVAKTALGGTVLTGEGVMGEVRYTEDKIDAFLRKEFEMTDDDISKMELEEKALYYQIGMLANDSEVVAEANAVVNEGKDPAKVTIKAPDLPTLETPSLDKLASQPTFGAYNRYSAPVCSPSRAALMTGYTAAPVCSPSRASLIAAQSKKEAPKATKPAEPEVDGVPGALSAGLALGAVAGGVGAGGLAAAGGKQALKKEDVVVKKEAVEPKKEDVVVKKEAAEPKKEDVVVKKKAVDSEKSALPAFLNSSTEDMSGEQLFGAVAEAKAYDKENDQFQLSTMFNISSGAATAISWVFGKDNFASNWLNESAVNRAKEEISAFNKVSVSGGHSLTVRDPSVKVGGFKPAFG